MRTPIRTVLMWATVALVGGVAFAAAALNPPGTRAWLIFCAIMATGLAVQAVTSEPRDLIPALLFSTPAVVGLVSKGSPAWLGPPLACLLLVAAELGSLSWEGPGRMIGDGSFLHRLGEVGFVAVLGLGLAALIHLIARPGIPGGTWAIVVGAVGLVGVALVAFPSPFGGIRRQGGSTEG